MQRSRAGHTKKQRIVRDFDPANFLQSGGWALVAVTLVGLLLGGGGSPSPLSELLVQFALLAIFAVLAFTQHGNAYSVPAVFAQDRAIAWAWTALVALYLVQLVPLPPSAWNALPGREAIAANLQGFEARPWLPLSIAPERTLASLLSLLPPIIAYMVASGASPNSRKWFFPTLAAFAVCTITLQLMQTTGRFFLYDGTQTQFPNGFQANRNAQADILAFLLAALALRPRGKLKLGGFAMQQAALGLPLCVAIILTGSRAGVLMLLLILPVFAFQLLHDRFLQNKSLPGWRTLGLAAIAVVFAAAGGLFAALQNQVVGRTLRRFFLESDNRFEIVWPDAIFAARELLPWGAGFGTFVPAYQLFESNESFVAQFANRAHNEPLEVLIEAGIPGLLIVLAGVVLICWRAIDGVRKASNGEQRHRAAFLLVVTLLISLHSLVDYPLRSMSIAILLSTVLGLVVADRRDRARGTGPNGGGAMGVSTRNEQA